MTPRQQATVEAEAAKRRALEASGMAAFQVLRDNKDFDIAWCYLQRKFPLNEPSFVAGDEGNTHKAAMRDGQKQVMREILRLLSLPREADFEDGDAKLRPTSAVSDLSAQPTNV